MELQCPQCEYLLQRTAELKRHCKRCRSNYRIVISCNTCGDEIKRLSACGTVSHWCNHCNELKSKSLAVYTLVIDD